MRSIDFHIAALAGQVTPQSAEHASIPQPQDLIPPPLPNDSSAGPLPSAPQDRVSLSGTVPPNRGQQSAQSNGNLPSAAFALLPQEITFPPGQSTADVFSTSTFPPA